MAIFFTGFFLLLVDWENKNSTVPIEAKISPCKILVNIFSTGAFLAHRSIRHSRNQLTMTLPSKRICISSSSCKKFGCMIGCSKGFWDLSSMKPSLFGCTRVETMEKPYLFCIQPYVSLNTYKYRAQIYWLGVYAIGEESIKKFNKGKANFS